MSYRFWRASATAALLCAGLASIAGAALRGIEPEDFSRFATLDELQVSPDGQWLAYTVSSADPAADEAHSALWLVDWSGREHLQLTRGAKDVSAPRFSPDGRYIAYLETAAGAERPQIQLLDRRGGEARTLTQASGEIQSFEWSPDGRRMVLVVREDVALTPDAKTPPPLVIDALHFKQDRSGYRTAGQSQRLQLLQVDSGGTTPLGDAGGEQDQPVWSPDGRSIAFTRTDVGNGVDGKQDLMLIDARAGASARLLARVFVPNAQHLAFSPDGGRLAYLEGLEPRFNAYIADQLRVRPVAGGDAQPIAASLDRAIQHYQWQADGRAILAVVEDDQSSYPLRIDLRSGKWQRLAAGPMSTLALAQGGGHWAVLAADDHSAAEVHALETTGLRKLTAHNEALLAGLRLGAVEDLSFASADGTTIHGMMVKPPGFVAGRAYATILWIHGGPNGQDEHSLLLDGYPLQFERQFLAGQGYVVLAVNYRGSSGRGAQFQQAIWGDWCHHEVDDLRAALDHMIARGSADPQRLGVGGWSYGGILTDCMIAADTRLRAAVSGAGSSNQLSMFGSDQYVLQYVNELGPPWRNTDAWLKVSQAFFQADRIRTPTLFLGGQSDFNVPIAGGEQMYQALRVLGVPTQLAVYPGQFHILTRPSYIVDRARRVRDWYARHLR